jgi:hypothetical protein
MGSFSTHTNKALLVWVEKRSFPTGHEMMTSTHSFLFLHSLYLHPPFCHSFTTEQQKSFHLIFNPFRRTFNYILQMHVTQRVLQTWQNNKLNKHEDKLWNTAFWSPGYTLLMTHNKYVVIFVDNIFVMIIVWWTIILFGVYCTILPFLFMVHN